MGEKASRSGRLFVAMLVMTTLVIIAGSWGAAGRMGPAAVGEAAVG